MSRLDDIGVYFIQAVDGGLIKIGRSDDPVRRLAELQSGSPVELDILFTARCDDLGIDEGEIHRRFAQYRVRGEWFEPAEPILQYIEELRAKLSAHLRFQRLIARLKEQRQGSEGEV